MKPGSSLLSTLSLVLITQLILAHQQQPDTDSCSFSIKGDQIHPTIAGPEDIVRLLYVVEQPDSPLGILSVDLEGTKLSVSNGQFNLRDCFQIKVLNRSDHEIRRFAVRFALNDVNGGGPEVVGQGLGLGPGQTTEAQSCNGGGSGAVPQNHVRLIASVSSIDLGGCLYKPSLRIPRSLGIHPTW